MNNQTFRIGTVVWYVSAALFFIFLLLPLLILIVVSFNSVAMVFPPQGFTFRWYAAILEKSEFLSAATVSLSLGLMTALLATACGIAAALALGLWGNRTTRAINFFLLSPLFIPGVLIALALFQLQLLLGWRNSIWILVGAHTVVTIPYALRNIVAQLEIFDRSMIEAALTVGANYRQAVMRVVLPLLKTSVVPSFVVTFVLSWNNYTISVFLAPNKWTTLPLQLRAYLQYEYEPFVASMSTVLILFSACVLLLVEKLYGKKS